MSLGLHLCRFSQISNGTIVKAPIACLVRGFLRSEIRIHEDFVGDESIIKDYISLRKCPSYWQALDVIPRPGDLPCISLNHHYVPIQPFQLLTIPEVLTYGVFVEVLHCVSDLLSDDVLEIISSYMVTYRLPVKELVAVTDNENKVSYHIQRYSDALEVGGCEKDYVLLSCKNTREKFLHVEVEAGTMINQHVVAPNYTIQCIVHINKKRKFRQ